MTEKPQLFLLHFAGGNEYSFHFMRHLLPDFDFISLELPGRGKRFNEELLVDFEAAAADYFSQILARNDTSEFIIYGHSMGACLALKVSSMLEKIGRKPFYIVVSGHAWNSKEDANKRHLKEDKDFLEDIKSMGGIPNEVFTNEQLMILFTPILKADFAIVENMKIERDFMVNVPIYAIMGSDEESAEQVTNWRETTKSCFEFKILKGDHFFIYNHSIELTKIIRGCYAKCNLLQH